MTSWIRNTISKLYKAVSAPVAAIRDALAERLQSKCETTSLLYNKMMQDMGYERERFKDKVKKEAREEEKEGEQ